MTERETQGIATRQEILTAIRIFTERYGYSPTYQEISDMTDIRSKVVIKSHLDILEEEGYIWKCDSMPRTIKILRDRYR